jgi:hypothetical protein
MQVKYFAWLEAQLEEGKSLNEYDAASQLETFRQYVTLPGTIYARVRAPR